MKNILSILFVVLFFTSCEKDDTISSEEDTNNQKLSIFKDDYGLEDTNYIVLEAGEVYEISQLKGDEFEKVLLAFKGAKEYIYDLEEHEVFVFEKRNDANSIKAKSFNNPYIERKPSDFKKRTFVIEYAIFFFEAKDFGGLVVSYQGIQRPKTKPKGRVYSRSNIGREFNDKLSSYKVSYKTNFPMTLTGRFYKDDMFRNELHKFTYSDLTGPFYSIGFLQNEIVSWKDQMTSWAFTLSFVD